MLKYTFLLLATSIIISCNSGSDQKSTSSPEQSQQIELLTPDEFEKKLNNTSDYTLLDVRTNMEVQKGYIEGKKSIDWFEDGFEEKVKNAIPDKDEPVFVYCAIGGRSQEAADKLADMGYQKIYDLDGGYNRWFEQQKPIKIPNQ